VRKNTKLKNMAVKAILKMKSARLASRKLPFWNNVRSSAGAGERNDCPMNAPKMTKPSTTLPTI
jgi:hypothetical protein